MKIHVYILSFICIAVVLSAAAQDRVGPTGFVDENRDGMNDRFADADGDGVNDMTGRPYSHAFPFMDTNGDGINDFWTDADGDGVNDLLGQIQGNQGWVDADGDGIMDEGAVSLRGRALKAHVLDADQDGRNDITGVKYTGRDLFGFRFGYVDEESGIVDSDFMDANGDGMNDNFSERGQGRYNAMDLFIDADGDGIADNRGLGQLKNRGRQRGKK